MRHVSRKVAGFLRRIGSSHPALVYGAFVMTLTIGIANLALVVAHVAVVPVVSLLEFGDEPASRWRGAVPVQSASAVLEADEWLENLKSNFSGRGASSSHRSNLGNSASQTTIGLFGNPPPAATSNNGAKEGESPNARRRPRSDTHRTMCVRLCDGYYFPISYATTSERFEDDERACQRSCSSPAKLYVYRNPGQEPEDMVNLDGRPYTKLMNAFLFRTKLDQACKCNPHPWEQAATDRHRKYAEDAARTKAERQAAVEAAARTGRSAKGPANGAPPPNEATTDKAARASSRRAEPVSQPSKAVLTVGQKPRFALLNAAQSSTDATAIDATTALADGSAPPTLQPVKFKSPPVDKPQPVRARQVKSQHAALPNAKIVAIAASVPQPMRLGANSSTNGGGNRAPSASDWRNKAFAAR